MAPSCKLQKGLSNRHWFQVVNRVSLFLFTVMTVVIFFNIKVFCGMWYLENRVVMSMAS